LNAFYHGQMVSRLANGDTFPTEVMLDGYAVANARVVFAARPGVFLFVQARNLFDNEYRTYSGTLRLHDGIPARGRTVTAGAGWRY
jgi:outer membrane receptor protein involved in Fe transport